ncbi:MAG TPA: hypothetical protein EYQ14_12520, partial [Gammaproteobacteria bacterium]|nr:hypothetical protein [Gammaproteobacteria bacterium]
MIKLEALLAIALLLCAAVAAIARDDEWQSMRKEMIEEIKQDMVATRSYTGKEALSDPVLAALARVERHEFIPEELRDQAYDNYPLPIGNDQTISQPFIVALMTELLEVGQDSIILEIGTGSAYQAAMLAEIVKEVYTVEIIADLANQAHGKSGPHIFCFHPWIFLASLQRW